MRSYEDVAPIMDARVRDLLGVSILYAAQSGAYVTVKGWIIDTDPADETSAMALDEIPQRKRLKIDAAELERAVGRPKPSTHDRIQHPRLGEGVWRPSSKKPRQSGRSWIFDVQRSTAQL